MPVSHSNMKTRLKGIFSLSSSLYAAAVVGWFALRFAFGDSVWWLALLNAFAPFFFAPLVLLLPAGLVCRRLSFWMCVLPPLVIFLFLYGHLFLPAWPVGATTEGAPLTIASFNIWGFSQSVETARAILQDGTPDIVAFQELGPEMAEMLVREIGDIYPYHAIGIGTFAYGGAVFSRYPLVELDSSHLVDPNWRVQILRVEAGGQVLILYNVHLQASNVLAFFDGGTTFAGKIEASFRDREAQARRLMADVATRTEPIIVAGDFNSAVISDVHRMLAQSLTDAHQAVGWGFGHTFPAYSGNWKGIPIVPRQMRLDTVFCSADFAALSSRVGSDHGESDHLPVFVQLAWRKQSRIGHRLPGSSN